MFTFTKSDNSSTVDQCMFIAANGDHDVPGLTSDDFKTVTNLGDFSWDGKSLCATVYVMSGVQVSALVRTAGVLLPVSRIYTLDEDLVMYGAGIVSYVSAAEMGLALAQQGLRKGQAELESSTDEDRLEDQTDV